MRNKIAQSFFGTKKRTSINLWPKRRTAPGFFILASEQRSLLLDFSQNIDYFIGDQSHYSHRYCIRKRSETDVVVTKMMVKLSKWSFASLLVKLEYNHREKLQLLKVEQLTFILIRPDDKEALTIWRELKHLQ